MDNICYCLPFVNIRLRWYGLKQNVCGSPAVGITVFDPEKCSPRLKNNYIWLVS